MRVLLVDNFDSFTHNLFQALSVLGAQVEVMRNDVAEIRADTTHLVISPGPGRPERAGRTPALIRSWAGKLPILGVCLGHQALAQAFGGKVEKTAPMHGKTSPVHHDGKGIFWGVPDPFVAARYHSLQVLREGLPDCLEVSAWTEDGTIMGLRHRSLAAEGIQFHPESFLTPHGGGILAGFLGRK